MEQTVDAMPLRESQKLTQIIGDVHYDKLGRRAISYRWDGDGTLALVDAAVAALWGMPDARRRAVGYQFAMGGVKFFVREYDVRRGAFVVERIDS